MTQNQHVFWKIITLVSDKSKIIGAACLIGMTALTCFDVVGRLFKHPIFGSVELVSFMGVMAVAFALGNTHEAKSHIGVELLVMRLSRKWRAIIDGTTQTISLLFFGLVTWRMFDYALKMQQSGEVSMNLRLPEYLLIFVVALCFIVFSLVILKNIFESFGKLRDK